MSSETNKNDEVRIYEVGYLIVPSVPQEKIGDETKALTELITSKGATIIASEDAEMRPLAYTFLKKVGPINERFNQAYFGWVKFEVLPDQIEGIKKWIDENDHILRHLLMITPRENTYLGKKSATPVLLKDEAELPKEEVAPEAEAAKASIDTVKSV